MPYGEAFFTKRLSRDQNQAIDSMANLARFKGLLEGFSQYLMAEKNFSDATKTSYQSDLMGFLSYLAEHAINIGPEDLNREKVRAYLAWAKETKNLAAASRARHVSALRSFYKYLMDND